jgi:hypothetical protein
MITLFRAMQSLMITVLPSAATRKYWCPWSNASAVAQTDQNMGGLMLVPRLVILRFPWMRGGLSDRL